MPAMKRRRKKSPKKKKRRANIPHHNVYVIELGKKVLQEKKFLDANPKHDPEEACFYVGMTGHTPRKRFNQHRANYKANKYVREYGLWLRKRIFNKYNPMTYDDAAKMEVELANRLRAKGHAVWQH